MIVLLSLALLGGCSDADWAHVMSYGDAPAYPVAAPATIAAANYAAYSAAPAPPSAAQRCERAARDRMSDIETQGFDSDVQQAVHDNTYADCMAWAARRPTP